MGNTAVLRLYRAPLDCSAKAAKVTLPKVAGSDATWMSGILHRNETGDTIALVAGASSSGEVMVVDDATGKVATISDAPGKYPDPGNLYAYQDTYLDISPKGTNIAYLKYKSSTSSLSLYVRPVNKSKSAVLVSTTARFASDYKSLGGVQFINEDDLVFWAGTSSYTQDMFMVKVSTGQLTQITKTGGTTQPYSGSPSQPTLYARGGWISPNGQYLFFLQCYNVSMAAICNIRAVQRATGTVKDITTNMQVYYSSNLEAAATGGKVFFSGRSPLTTSDNLYVFDQNSASAPQQLTSFNGSSHIHAIMPSANGSRVAFSMAKTSSSTDEHMYVAQVQVSPVVTQLTSTPGDISDMKMFTKNGKYVVYGYSTSYTKSDLRVQPITGGPTTVLDPVSSNYTSTLMVW